MYIHIFSKPEISNSETSRARLVSFEIKLISKEVSRAELVGQLPFKNIYVSPKLISED